jgi:hypothetical protein
MSVGDKLTLEFLPLELQKKIAEKVEFEDVTKDSLTWDNYLDTLEKYVGWLSLFISAMIRIRSEGSPWEGDYGVVKQAMSTYNRVAKKIKKERPESGTLKTYSELLNKAKIALKSYESTIPKPHWSDEL